MITKRLSMQELESGDAIYKRALIAVKDLQTSAVYGKEPIVKLKECNGRKLIDIYAYDKSLYRYVRCERFEV